MTALGSLMDLKFEFENEAGKEFDESTMSKENPPSLILFLSSGWEDFLIGEG
jgi:hypothetical protein